ncbi:hypothetical protein QUC31_006061 [Theobroma cacao]|uniref:NAC domain-containing protein 101 n=2 Tax=Theobroma cacao TaxID=3641 RepID=A0AB32X097_THECC|nr:PREDICTED: NAC domain-containing protein 101 [Theobroma cacao]
MFVGFGFKPSDRSLTCYLFSKVTSKSMLHLDQVQIKDFDLYGEKEPWEIWDLHGGCNLQSDEDLYFFTKLKKKSQNGSRINRSVGTGTWMGEDSGKPIYSQLSAIQPLGFKRRFRYEGGVPQQVGQWIMHEYSLNTTLVPENDQGYVLCRVRKNDREEKKAEKRRKLIT